jgi:hypothetical protein
MQKVLTLGASHAPFLPSLFRVFLKSAIRNLPAIARRATAGP